MEMAVSVVVVMAVVVVTVMHMPPMVVVMAVNVAPVVMVMAMVMMVVMMMAVVMSMPVRLSGRAKEDGSYQARQHQEYRSLGHRMFLRLDAGWPLRPIVCRGTEEIGSAGWDRVPPDLEG